MTSGRGHFTRLECNSISHSIQPPAERTAVGNQRPAADQDKKRGLEGVFRVRQIAQQPAADGPYVPGMSLDQMFERFLVLML